MNECVMIAFILKNKSYDWVVEDAEKANNLVQLAYIMC